MRGCRNTIARSAAASPCYMYKVAESAASNTPTVYLNGTAVSVTVATAPVGTFSPVASAIYVGNRSTNDRNWDGKIADFAYWGNTILTASEAKALSKGVSPLQIRRSALSLYLPLGGYQSHEPDWSTGHVSQTILGTKFQPNAPTSGYPLTQ